MNSLAEVLALEYPCLTAIVGSGGKTSFMFRLASESQGQGLKVVTSTTTKIFYPSPAQSSRVILDPDPHRLADLTAEALKTHTHITIACETNHQNKLIGIDPQLADRLFNSGIFDLLVVEADGARGLGLKAPGPYEPVIPSAAGLVVAVVGLGTVGKTLTEATVFRPELFAEMADMPLGAVIRPEHVARVLVHPQGHFKNTPAGAKKVVLLNQADLVESDAAARMADLIMETGRPNLDRVIWGSLQRREQVFGLVTG